MARDRRPAGTDDLVDDLVGAVGHVVDDHRRTGGRQCERLGLAQAGSGPGDQCGLALEAQRLCHAHLLRNNSLLLMVNAAPDITVCAISPTGRAVLASAAEAPVTWRERGRSRGRDGGWRHTRTAPTTRTAAAGPSRRLRGSGAARSSR